MTRFYVIDGFNERGPYTARQLQNLNISPDTIVRHSKNRIRMFARDFHELSHIFISSKGKASNKIFDEIRERFKNFFSALRNFSVKVQRKSTQ